MSRPPDKSPTSLAARDRAVEWHVRLSSDAAEEADWLAFEAWLADSPENVRAYEAVEAVWLDLDAAPAQSANVVRFKPRPKPWIWGAGLAASVALAAALGVGVRLGNPPPAVYETAKGATREITLADGSRIRLNSGSHIEVRLGRRERRVEMADAEAAFDVAHDPNRPFIITAGDRQIRVVGTEFDVLRHAGQVSVSVRRGIVEVRTAQADTKAAPVARLVRGQALRHQEGGEADVVQTVEPDQAFSWTQGRLVYRNATLGEVAADLNRYVSTPIVVDPAVRGLRLTAVLEIDTEDAMVRRLSAFLPVSAVREGETYRISSRH